MEDVVEVHECICSCGCEEHYWLVILHATFLAQTYTYDTFDDAITGAVTLCGPETELRT